MSIRKIILYIIVLFSVNQAEAQRTEKYKKENTNSTNIYKTLISIGVGSTLDSYSKNQLIFSFDFIPGISKTFFLDFKIDGINQDKSYNTLFSIIPEYKLYFDKDGNFAGYFGVGPTLFLYPKGHPGLDAAITAQGKIEYSLKRFFMNMEMRKPIYFYEDSGHMDLLLSINFGIKI